jgi:acyl carrier protein phosphodiesterase
MTLKEALQQEITHKQQEMERLARLDDYLAYAARYSYNDDEQNQELLEMYNDTIHKVHHERMHGLRVEINATKDRLEMQERKEKLDESLAKIEASYDELKAKYEEAISKLPN